MQVSRLSTTLPELPAWGLRSIYFLAFLTALAGSLLLAAVSNAQTLERRLKPNVQRALGARPDRFTRAIRPGVYVPSRAQQIRGVRPRQLGRKSTSHSEMMRPARTSSSTNAAALSPILPGTPLNRVLHTSQFSLSSTAGTVEQFVDRNNDLMADERTTFDAAGGAFDVAVGHSGARYEVFGGTLNNNPIGVVVIARDTNGDYQMDTFTTFNLRPDFELPSAASVVAGRSIAGREFVVVCSSGYFNSADPGDPLNEPSPGIVLLVRDPNTGGFDNSLSVELVGVGDDRLFNANALALLPNNNLLVADFASNEVRIIRDTNADGLPDTLDAVPYFSSPFANEEPLDIAVNSLGVVFSHSSGNDTTLLALYDDNGDGRSDRDEVVVEGLSIDNNLFLHGLTVTGLGDVYVIEDANGSEDGAGGNGGTPRIDAFPDPYLNGILNDGLIFVEADSSIDLGLSGLAFGLPQPNPIEHSVNFFVRQHYRDFLNREPDAAGLAFWSGQITSCGTDAQCIEIKRINVSAAFFLSIEFQETGYLVYRMYKAAYGNLSGAPVPLTRGEFLPDTRQIGQGVEVGRPGWEELLAANKNTYAADFVSRSRFTTAYPPTLTAAQFVDTLNQNAGGALSPSERDQLVNDLASGAKNRAQVVRAVAEDSDLARNEFNKAFVLMQYYGYLLRNPNDMPDLNFSGFDFWLAKLNQFNGNFVEAEMVKAFLNSGEYKHRFGP
ncbi:MAG: DUF4214 domain-containing protein [Pyrinomonadaceae bacterium]|nr:DUF4214 domain-containing protein [Pyrinomonadaceae bacterium]